MGSSSRAAHYVLGYLRLYPWLFHMIPMAIPHDTHGYLRLYPWFYIMIPTVVFCHARYYLLHYTALSHTKPFLWLKILDCLPVGYGILYLRAC